MPAPTPEQAAIIKAAADTNDSLLIEARAGSGKTTTLLQILPKLSGNTVLMAFNKAIANELKNRTSDLPFEVKLGLEIGTVHALGLKAYIRGHGKKPRIQGGKVNFIIRDLLKPRPAKQRLFKPVTYLIGRMVGTAKNYGFGLSSTEGSFFSINDLGAWYSMLEHNNWDVELDKAGIDADEAIDLAMRALTVSNQQHDLIDFDDMIYLPLLLNHKLTQYSNVLIDEAQDISATRRELAFRMLAPGGRIIAVGDEYQAIYGFTGADAESLTNIQRRADAITLPLSICWRCDADIIAEAQKTVPDIRPKPNAPSGAVSRIDYSTVEMALAGNLPAEKYDAELLPTEGDAILCRLNKPNVSMALALLRAGKRARIEGRDLGTRLASHVKAADPLYAHRSLEELVESTRTWGEEECRKLAAMERASSAAIIEDEVGAAIILLERCIEQAGEGYADFEWLVSDLFDDDIPPSGVITLASVHKSKGREWPRVFLLGRNDYMPFHLAKQDWEKQQERNLIYVAQTRAEHHLIYITGVQSALDKRKS